ncbi:MAG: flagellar basal body P-ring formation chaperone FlgA [Candidatus Margulisbacteria bacterium]|jgi:flagella basal body P-ring formation protein FlgA|nr:flagellar basal body P-ring formation chaperone FlgA [Candidatus Margulisiibacteriota bacterium]
MNKLLISLMVGLMIASGAAALSDPEQRVGAVLKDFIVARYPAWDRAEIVLTYKQADKVWAALRELPDQAAISVLPVMPDFKPAGNVIFPLLVTGETGDSKFLLRTRVEVMKNVVAVAQPIRRGTALTAELLKLEKRDVALLPPKYFTETAGLGSWEARIGIPANSTLFVWMIGAPPLLRRGSQVDLLVSAPGLLVKAKGEALEDGQPDQLIKVKRLDSGKILAAKVKSTNEVEVTVE